MRTKTVVLMVFIPTFLFIAFSCSLNRDSINPFRGKGEDGGSTEGLATGGSGGKALANQTGGGNSEVDDKQELDGGEDMEDRVDAAGPADTNKHAGAGGESGDQNRNGDGGSVGSDASEKDASSQLPLDASTNPAEVPTGVVTIGPFKYGDWDYFEVEGAVCRDGSPAGYYIRKGTSKNLMIFLNGGGVCYDEFFCSANPANVDQSLSADTLLGSAVETFTSNPVRQIPSDEGILQKDRRNPVKDWTMVFIPYCTGDVYAGTLKNAPVITSPSMSPQQFVGYTNIGLFYASFGLDYLDSEKVLLAGSAAGGFGAFLNFERTYKFFHQSELYILTDSGFPFRDEYLPTCLQKNWRQLWGIDRILPPDCDACFSQSGGGIAEGLGQYEVQKYGNRVLGGGVSSLQDEVMKLFFSAGNNDCETNNYLEAVAAITGRSTYPVNRYPDGLRDFFENVTGWDITGSYIISGSTHQHIFRSRFYENNNVGTTIADWLGQVLQGNAEHVGLIQ